MWNTNVQIHRKIEYWNKIEKVTIKLYGKKEETNRSLRSKEEEPVLPENNILFNNMLKKLLKSKWISSFEKKKAKNKAKVYEQLNGHKI